MARLPGVLEIADVSDEREEYEKSIDGYLLEHFLYHRSIGWRSRTEEANLTKLLRKHKCEQYLAEWDQAACQNLLDCGNNFIAVLFSIVSMP